MHYTSQNLFLSNISATPKSAQLQKKITQTKVADRYLMKNELPDEIEEDIKLKSLITQQSRGESANAKSAAYVSNTPRRELYNKQQKSDSEVPLLPPRSEADRNKKTLIVDLDETLVHSSFKPVANAHIILPVEIEGKICNVFILKRPGIEEFLSRLSVFYEIVIFTASLSKYADPLMDKLDPTHYTSARLFREHCTFYNGIYIKDLSKMGRDLKDLIIVDNSPSAYAFQPDNAFPATSWYDDPEDTELFRMIPLLEMLAYVEDVRKDLPRIVVNNQVQFDKATTLLRSSLGAFYSRDRKQAVKLKTTTANSRSNQDRSSTSKTRTNDTSSGLNDTTPMKSAPLRNTWTEKLKNVLIEIGKEKDRNSNNYEELQEGQQDQAPVQQQQQQYPGSKQSLQNSSQLRKSSAQEMYLSSNSSHLVNQAKRSSSIRASSDARPMVSEITLKTTNHTQYLSTLLSSINSRSSNGENINSLKNNTTKHSSKSSISKNSGEENVSLRNSVINKQNGPIKATKDEVFDQINSPRYFEMRNKKTEGTAQPSSRKDESAPNSARGGSTPRISSGKYTENDLSQYRSRPTPDRTDINYFGSYLKLTRKNTDGYNTVSTSQQPSSSNKENDKRLAAKQVKIQPNAKISIKPMINGFFDESSRQNTPAHQYQSSKIFDSRVVSTVSSTRHSDVYRQSFSKTMKLSTPSSKASTPHYKSSSLGKRKGNEESTPKSRPSSAHKPILTERSTSIGGRNVGIYLGNEIRKSTGMSYGLLRKSSEERRLVDGYRKN